MGVLPVRRYYVGLSSDTHVSKTQGILWRIVSDDKSWHYMA